MTKKLLRLLFSKHRKAQRGLTLIETATALWVSAAFLVGIVGALYMQMQKVNEANEARLLNVLAQGSKLYLITRTSKLLQHMPLGTISVIPLFHGATVTIDGATFLSVADAGFLHGQYTQPLSYEEQNYKLLVYHPPASETLEGIVYGDQTGKTLNETTVAQIGAYIGKAGGRRSSDQIGTYPLGTIISSTGAWSLAPSMFSTQIKTGHPLAYLPFQSDYNPVIGPNFAPSLLPSWLQRNSPDGNNYMHADLDINTHSVNDIQDVRTLATTLARIKTHLDSSGNPGILRINNNLQFVAGTPDPNKGTYSINKGSSTTTSEITTTTLEIQTLRPLNYSSVYPPANDPIQVPQNLYLYDSLVGYHDYLNGGTLTSTVIGTNRIKSNNSKDPEILLSAGLTTPAGSSNIFTLCGPGCGVLPVYGNINMQKITMTSAGKTATVNGITLDNVGTINGLTNPSGTNPADRGLGLQDTFFYDGTLYNVGRVDISALHAQKLVLNINSMSGFILVIRKIKTKKLGDNGHTGTINTLLMNGHQFTSTSDRRLKTHFTPLKRALHKLEKLTGYSFTWRKTKEKSMGVIAQEVEKVYPSLVHHNKDGYLSVNYQGLIAPIIEAIKTMTSRLFNLRATLNDTQKEILKEQDVTVRTEKIIEAFQAQQKAQEKSDSTLKAESL